MVIPMVSNIRLAVFMVGTIISFTLPVLALVKVRKEDGVMKYIMIGVITSFMVMTTRTLILVLSSGVAPDMYKTENLFINFFILLGLELISLALVYSILMKKFVKETMTKATGLAMALGYLINVTITNVLMYLNYFTGSFALNAGQLQEIFNQEEFDMFVKSVVDPTTLFHLTSVLLVVVTWFLFAKLFSLDYKDGSQRKMAYGLILVQSSLGLLIGAQVIPVMVGFALALVLVMILVRDFKQAK